MTEEEKLAAVLFVGSLEQAERQSLGMKAIQRKRDAFEMIMAIARQEGIGLWFANPVRRHGYIPNTIVMEGDGDIHTEDEAGAAERMRGGSGMFSGHSKHEYVIGPDYGTAHDKLAYWKRQGQYQEAWANLKQTLQGDKP